MSKYLGKKLKVTWNEELAKYYGIKISKVGYQIEQYDDENEDEGSLHFGCEITPIEGKTISRNIILKGAVLNKKGAILADSDPLRLYANEFYIEKLWSTGMLINLKGIYGLKFYIDAL